MSHNAAADRDAIKSLNIKMHTEEKRGVDGIPVFSQLLDQTLRFRRASGAVITRDEFLIGLANPNNRRELIEPVGEIWCEVFENTALASVLLRVRGENNGEPFEGLFRNHRIFHRDAAERPWTLKIWFNDPVPG